MGEVASGDLDHPLPTLTTSGYGTSGFGAGQGESAKSGRYTEVREPAPRMSRAARRRSIGSRPAQRPAPNPEERTCRPSSTAPRSTVAAAAGVARPRMSLRRILLAAVLWCRPCVVATTGGLIASEHRRRGATPPPPSGDGVLFAWGSNLQGEFGLPADAQPAHRQLGPRSDRGRPSRASPRGQLRPGAGTRSSRVPPPARSAGAITRAASSATAELRRRSATPRSRCPPGVELKAISTGAGALARHRHQRSGVGVGHGLAAVCSARATRTTAPPRYLSPSRGPRFDPPVTAVAVAASNTTSWAVGSDGLVYVWGNDYYGRDTCSARGAACVPPSCRG